MTPPPVAAGHPAMREGRWFAKYTLASPGNLLFGVYCVIVAVVCVQRLMLGPSAYNNFSIFRWSYFNLLHGDLYAAHPDQHNDLFKYSPTFALFMAPFFWLPAQLGLVVWTALNVFVPFWAVNRLAISPRARAFILLFVALELVGSLQNMQSNALMAGLMVGTFVAFEEEKPELAALLVCAGFFVKVFPVVAALLFVMYPQRRRFVVAMALFGTALGILPIAVIGADNLLTQYQSWIRMVGHDAPGVLNYSIMTLTQRVFDFSVADVWYLVPGCVLLTLPVVRRSRWPCLDFRLTYLASVLVWVVIFNHKAESPTYVIAMMGVAIWGVTEGPSRRSWALLVFVFILTGLSATDAFPAFLRDNYVRPYALKALPCVLAWLTMTYVLLREDTIPRLVSEAARPVRSSEQQGPSRRV